jgi:hypothetical protein
MFKNLIETYKINKNLLAKNPELSNILIGAIAVISVIIYFYYFKFSGNITGFFRIGSVLPLSPFLIPDQTLIFQDELGYDGQQFLSLALDPFLQDLDTLASLDHPAYRYRRILYPLLSYFLGFGNSQIIPYVMVAINAIAILLIIWVTGLYFKSYSAKVNQALFVLTIPGVWIVLSLSTSDLLASLFFVSAFYFYQNNKPIYMALMVSLGCLTRETLLLLWISLLFSAIWQKKDHYFKYLGMALIPPLAWNIYVIFLGLNGASGTGNFGIPFVGIIQKFLSLFTPKFSPKTFFEAYLFILVILAFALVFWLSFPRRSANRPLLVCGLIYLGMFSMSSLLILNYYLDYSRVFMDVYFLALLSIDFRSFPRKTIFFSASSLASIAFLVLHS